MIKRTFAAVLLAAAAQMAFAETAFPSAEAAVEALATAVANHDQRQLDEMFGPDYQAFRQGQQSDPALAQMRFERFAAALKEFHSLTREGDKRMTLVIGAAGWPFPIPLLRSGKRWHFDGKSGVEELRNRLVGANELYAIAVLDVYREAQHDYAREDHDGDGVLEYAQRVSSTPGTQDGLYWDIDSDDANAVASPLGTLHELAEAVLGERPVGAPLLGYRFRLLSAQGAHAKAGAYDYRINGHMVGGFAMIAWPANYDDTGVMSFMVNQDGVIYQSDLGKDTATAVEAITRFDPVDGWIAVDDSEVVANATP